MPFMTLNGITIPVVADSFVDVAERVGALATRSASGARVDTWQANPRSWNARTTIRTFAEIDALRRLIDGHGHVWHLDESSAPCLSTGGIAPDAGSSYTPVGSGGKHGGRATVSSGGSFLASLGSFMSTRSTWGASNGWTLLVWKILSAGDGGDGSTWYHHIATGTVAVTRGAAANPANVTQYRNGVAGSYSMGNWISVSASGVVGIHGYSNANAATAYGYDDFVVLPFVLPSSWASALYTFHDSRAWPDTPRLVLGGDCVPSAVEVSGMSGGMSQHNAVLGGAHTSTARALAFDLFEV